MGERAETDEDRSGGEPLVGRASTWREPGGSRPIELDAAAPGSAPRVPRPALDQPSRSRLRPRRPEWVPRGRALMAAAFVIILSAAWIAIRPHDSGGAIGVAESVPRSTRAPVSKPKSPPKSTSTPIRPPQAVRRALAVPRWVPAAIASTCRAEAIPGAPSVVDVECVPGRGVVALHYRAFESLAALRAADAADAANPADPGDSTTSGGSGPSACARGAPDERSWSTAAAPGVVAGRYRCDLAGRRARIVWTTERALVLAEAERADTDLRSLYQWWTTVPGPVTAAPGR